MNVVERESDKISNLITEMILRGATKDEMNRAVKHSMVVSDAEKHHLDYKQSEKDNGINVLKNKYGDDTNTKEIWEGWTPRDFIESLAPEIELIMAGATWKLPFKTAKEMTNYIKQNQPYYKKSIPEVNSYFIHLYGLEDTDHE